MSLDKMLEIASRNCSSSVFIDCMGSQRRLSHAELYRDVEAAIRKLQGAGIRSRARVGILATNSYDWLVIDLALIRMNCVSCCFPAEVFRNRSPVELVAECDLSLLLVEKSALQPGHPPYISALTLQDTELGVRAATGDVAALTDVDAFSVVFSSGTSGRLKKLVVSRRGADHQLELFQRLFGAADTDRILAFLPLSILPQRLMLFAALRYGFDFMLVDAPRLMNALQTFRPTILSAPPMFYEHVYNRFLALSPAVRRTIRAAAKLIRTLPLGKHLRRSAQRRVFQKFFDAFGGAVRLMVVGSAPSRRDMLEFYALLGLPLYEGYGVTETGYLTVNTPSRNRIGAVGQPLYDGIVEIAADGEIIGKVQHPLCLTYIGEDSDSCAATFIGSGRVATGDIGYLDAEGFLHLSGRKKEIIITSSGHKVHPEIIEAQLEAHESIRKAVVIVSEDQAGLIAVVSVAAKSRELIELVEGYVQVLNGENPPAFRIQKAVITEQPFDQRSGLLNRNLKVDRARVRTLCQEELSRERSISAQRSTS